MNRETGTVLFVGFSVLAMYLLVLRYETDHGRLLPNRWLSDDGDRGVYYTRAQFLPAGSNPYLDLRAEYPTLAILSFATPLLPSPGFRLRPEAYRFRWSCLMAATLLATVWLVAHVRVDQGFGAWPALILLAPSFLYFSLMRFDVICALLSCASIAAFRRGRYPLAHFLLGVGTFVKWYPALLLPVYASFLLSRDAAVAVSARQLVRTHAARYAGVFLLTVAALAAASVAAFTWQGFLVPYRFHAARGGQYFNLYWLVERYAVTRGVGSATWQRISLAFLTLQFAILPVLLLVRVRTFTEVLRYSILAIYLFITFAKIDSPQWVLWYVPLALMFVREPRTLVALIWLGVVNYLVFPVAYDAWGWLSPAFSTVVLVKDASLLILLVFILRERGSDDVETRSAQSTTDGGSSEIDQRSRANRTACAVPGDGRGFPRADC